MMEDAAEDEAKREREEEEAEDVEVGRFAEGGDGALSGDTSRGGLSNEDEFNPPMDDDEGFPMADDQDEMQPSFELDDEVMGSRGADETGEFGEDMALMHGEKYIAFEIAALSYFPLFAITNTLHTNVLFFLCIDPNSPYVLQMIAVSTPASRAFLLGPSTRWARWVPILLPPRTAMLLASRLTERKPPATPSGTSTPSRCLPCSRGTWPRPKKPLPPRMRLKGRK